MGRGERRRGRGDPECRHHQGRLFPFFVFAFLLCLWVVAIPHPSRDDHCVVHGREAVTPEHTMTHVNYIAVWKKKMKQNKNVHKRIF